MRLMPRTAITALILATIAGCTEAPQFMKDEQKSGVVIFAGQFAQGSMFRDNSAPESAYERPGLAAAPTPAPVPAAAPSFTPREPKVINTPQRRPASAAPSPI